MNIKRIVVAYLKKKANFPMPSALKKISFKREPELWLITAGNLIKKLVKAPGTPKIYEGSLGTVSLTFSDYDIITVSVNSTKIEADLLDVTSYKSDEDLWNILVDNFSFYQNLLNPSKIQKRLTSTIGIEFTKETDFDNSSKTYIFNFNNKLKGTRVTCTYDIKNRVETYDMMWEHGQAQTYTSLDELLDDVPTEYDIDFAIFKDKKKIEEIINKLNSAITPFTKKTPDWKKSKAVDAYNLDCDFRNESGMRTVISVTYHADHDFWTVTIDLDIRTEKPFEASIEDYKKILKDLPYCFRANIMGIGYTQGSYSTSVALNFNKIESSSNVIDTMEETFETLSSFKWV